MEILHGIVQTAAVLLWCGRGFWRRYPAWTVYGLLAILQNWTVLSVLFNWERVGGIWCVFAPLLILSLLDSILELFLRLSKLYRRFRRDRWKWLAIPVVFGLAVGLGLVWPEVHRFSRNFYRDMFVVNTVSGVVGASVLAMCWLASIPVRIPPNLRKHMMLLAIYVATNTFAYSGYLGNASDKQFIRSVLMILGPLVLVTWALVMTPDGDREEETEEEMPESTLEQIQALLHQIQGK